MSSRAYQRTRSWICRLVFRLFAILLCIVIMILSAQVNGWKIQAWFAITAINGLYSFVDFILLCVRKTMHQGIYMVVDFLFFFVSMVAGIGYMIVMNSSGTSLGKDERADKKNLVVEVLLILLGLIHLFQSVLSIKILREKRRAAKEAAWLRASELTSSLQGQSENGESVNGSRVHF